MVRGHRDSPMGPQLKVLFLTLTSGKLFLFFLYFYCLCVVGSLKVSGTREPKNMPSGGEEWKSLFLVFTWLSGTQFPTAETFVILGSCHRRSTGGWWLPCGLTGGLLCALRHMSPGTTWTVCAPMSEWPNNLVVSWSSSNIYLCVAVQKVGILLDSMFWSLFFPWILSIHPLLCVCLSPHSKLLNLVSCYVSIQ